MSTNKWGTPRVFTSVLDAISDDDECFSTDVEQRLSSSRISSLGHLRIALVCFDELRPHVSKNQMDEFERFSTRMERQLNERFDTRASQTPVWANELAHAEHHLRRVQGIERLAAIGGAVAWHDMFRDTRRGARFATKLVEGTLAVLQKKGVDIEAFAIRLLDVERL